MNVRVDPDLLMYEDLAESLPHAPALLEWGTLPTQQPYLTCVREFLPRELLMYSRLLVWKSGQKIRAGVRCYRTQSGRPATYVYAEAILVPAAWASIRKVEAIDVWVWRDKPADRMTDDDFQQLFGAVIAD